MGTKFWSGVGALASIAACVGAANAADLAVRKAPVYKAPPIIVSNWSGFYVGVNGGGGFGDNGSGGLGGGHVGYNWQFGTFVVGLEGDIDGADLTKTDAFGNTVKTDELGTVRGRAGYVFTPNVLAYGTAGYAYGHTNFDGVGLDQNGWAAGAGVEYKVWGPLIARAEYLHYGFDNANVGGNSFTSSVDVVRGGLSYKF